MTATFIRIWVALESMDLGQRLHRDEDAFSTAELLGNAALGIIALLAIWVALRQLGVDIVDWIRSSLEGEGVGAGAS